jgi:hypothetical protein
LLRCSRTADLLNTRIEAAVSSSANPPTTARLSAAIAPASFMPQMACRPAAVAAQSIAHQREPGCQRQELRDPGEEAARCDGDQHADLQRGDRQSDEQVTEYEQATRDRRGQQLALGAS